MEEKLIGLYGLIIATVLFVSIPALVFIVDSNEQEKQLEKTVDELVDPITTINDNSININDKKMINEKIKNMKPSREVKIIKNIIPKEAYVLIQNNKDNLSFVILDVRTLEEFKYKHLENAKNLDFFLAGFKDSLNELSKDKIYLIYCQTGYRSGVVLDMMNKLNFKQVYNMSLGIVQWELEALPLIKENSQI